MSTEEISTGVQGRSSKPENARSSAMALDRIWAQHVTLRRQLDELTQLLANDAEDAWVERGAALIAAIASSLPVHFALEEEQGYMADVLSVAPHFHDRAERLRRHHEVFVKEVGLLEKLISSESGSSSSNQALRERLGAFAKALADHEHDENALVRDAFSQALRGPDQGNARRHET